MFPERGRRQWRATPLAVNSDRTADHRHVAKRSATDRQLRFALNRLRIGERLAYRVDRTRRDSRPLQLLKPVRG